jgi:predicted transposase YbfD/YdcC
LETFSSQNRGNGKCPSQSCIDCLAVLVSHIFLNHDYLGWHVSGREINLDVAIPRGDFLDSLAETIPSAREKRNGSLFPRFGIIFFIRHFPNCVVADLNATAGVGVQKIDSMEEQAKNDFANCKARRHLTKETGHGREEIRSYVQMPVPKDLKTLELWKGLKSIGMATLVCMRDGKETTDTRYYISSLEVGVKQFGRAIRSHWGIENDCHWSLDRIYRDDESRLREPNLRENFAWLNRFTLSLLKQHPDKKQSTVMKRRSCGWSEDFLLEVITGATI